MSESDIRHFVCEDCRFISGPLFATPTKVSPEFSALIREHEGHAWREILSNELEKTKEAYYEVNREGIKQ